jgi:hypothetical protein
MSLRRSMFLYLPLSGRNLNWNYCIASRRHCGFLPPSDISDRGYDIYQQEGNAG